MNEKLIERILVLLHKEGPLSYAELAERLDTTIEDVKNAVGARFTELTKRSSHGLSKESDADLFFIGDNVKEISDNTQYQIFKNLKTKGNGMINWLLRRL